MEKEIFNTDEAAEYCNISKSKFIELRKNGRISYLMPNERSYRYTKKDLDDYLESTRVKAIK